MKLEQEPRIEAGPNFMFSLKDIFRKIAMAANGHDDALFGSTGSLAELSAGLVGLVGMFPVAAAPAGWLKANGATISRTAYAALFARIGTIYGAGDGSTTFRLPDLRGEFPRAWDDGRGVDAGRAIGSAQADMLRSHAHDYLKPNQTGAIASYGAASGPLVDPLPSSTVAFGGSETRPRNVALLACIKF